MSNIQSKFEIEVDDETTLQRDDTVAHVEHGPMYVEQISISASAKRARLKAELSEDGMSIELTGDEIRERWGKTLAATPMELHDGKTRYEKSFASRDDEIEITIKAAGPEDDVQPVMAHLDDQAVRALQAMEDELPPEECEGRYQIDWEAIFAEDADE